VFLNAKAKHSPLFREVKTAGPSSLVTPWPPGCQLAQRVDVDDDKQVQRNTEPIKKDLAWEDRRAVQQEAVQREVKL
jgi:hypothetical protein